MDAKKLDPPTVEERLAKLERQNAALGKQNRRLKVAGIVALVLVGAVVLVGAAAPTPKTIEAEKFVLVDSEGRRRGEFAVAENGTASLSLLDRQGNWRAKLATEANRCPLVAISDGQQVRAALGLVNDGSCGLTIYDKAGRRRVEAGLWQNRWSEREAGADSEERAYTGIWIFGNRTKASAGFQMSASGDPILVMTAADGKRLFTAPPPDDAPEEAEAEEGPWSLQIVPTASCAKDGAMLDCATKGSHFYVVLTNISESDLSVWREWCSWGYSCLSFQIALPDGSTFDVRKKPREWTKNYADPYLVRKGSHFVYAVRFDDRWEGFPEGWENQRVTIDAIFEIGEDRATKRLKVWTGKIESPKVEVDLYKQPSEN